jgi:hypothetical protein
MTRATTCLGTLPSKSEMEVDVFFVVRDGSAGQDNFLLEDNELKGHLFSRGAITTNPSGTVSVTFVGFVVWKSKFLLFLPKGCPMPASGDECGAVARLTLRVLKKYARNSFEKDPDARRLSRSLNDPKASGFALATWLADDFSKHGLYRRIRSKFNLSGNGTIDWTRTISKRSAHVSEDSFLYLDCITRDKVYDDSHFMTRLHLTALKLCKLRYADLLDLDGQLLENEGVASLDYRTLFGLGAVHLAKELRHTYADRSIRLFRVLDLLLKNDHPASATTFEAYGTSYFEHVWEAICSTIMGNDIADWLPVIPKPIWHTNSGEMAEAATLRPDIVRRHSYKGGDYVLLADAKYYSLSMPPLLSGNPGVGDVAKQLVYELIIVKEAIRMGIKFTGNCFVFPKEGQVDLVAIAGTVSYAAISAGPIYVVYMDLVAAMKRYVTSDGLVDEEIASLFGFQ